jgi:replicative DNA helicase
MEDYESEANVLSGMMNFEKSLYEGLTLLTEEHFTDTDFVNVFVKIRQLAEVTRPTFATVYKEVRNDMDARKITELKSRGMTADTFPYWMKKVNDLYIKRSYFAAAEDIKRMCMSHNSIAEIQELVENRILKINVREGTEQIITPEEAGKGALATFETRLKSKEKVHGIKLSRDIPQNGGIVKDGFPGIDKAMMGLKGGDLIMICAETGEGKTTLAQNIVRHSSIHQQHRTFYQNTEMDPEEMVYRFAAQLSGKDFGSIYSGDMNEMDAMAVRNAINEYMKSNVYTSELPLLTPERSRGLARQFKIKYGQLDLLVIDYVGRMELDNGKGKQEWQVMKEIAKQSKRLAQELDACVILIGQLTEEGKIQGAKAMANEADAVFFLEPLSQTEKESAPRYASHKLTPFKVRRGSKADRIWISFNKPKMYITEVT